MAMSMNVMMNVGLDINDLNLGVYIAMAGIEASGGKTELSDDETTLTLKLPR